MDSLEQQANQSVLTIKERERSRGRGAKTTLNSNTYLFPRGWSRIINLSILDGTLSKTDKVNTQFTNHWKSQEVRKVRSNHRSNTVLQRMAHHTLRAYHTILSVQRLHRKQTTVLLKLMEGQGDSILVSTEHQGHYWMISPPPAPSPPSGITMFFETQKAFQETNVLT